jgi:predicted polyphosphate/ATP-dependent NAD kinase
MRKIGLIVNPIAGIGGRLGFKGSDGVLAKKACELGGTSSAPGRTVEALHEILEAMNGVALLTYPSKMGQEEAVKCGIDPIVLGKIEEGNTTADDTKRAVREMIKEGVDLIVFSGGDGTARDVMEIVEERVPVLGIPAGVKMHSGVFAINPRLAGKLIINFLSGQSSTRPEEVLDYDDEGNLKLYGYMRVPYEEALIQESKSYIAGYENEAKWIAAGIIEEISVDHAYIIGPGTTAKALMIGLGVPYTLLGVDVVKGRKLLIGDANEGQLLNVVNRFNSKIVVGVVGGQGFLFGRGNQQISPSVIRKVGKENLIVLATEEKIASLKGKPLLVDTGDQQLDQSLIGYIRVNTGYRSSTICRVSQSRTL